MAGLAPSQSPLTAAQINARLAAYGLTLPDDKFTLQDNLDATKQLLLQLSGITTATIRTLTVPDASGTLALLSLAQTWSALQTFLSTDSALISLTSIYDEAGALYTQAQNTAATDVVTFALATYSGVSVDYVLTRGAGVIRKGRLDVAGDTAAPSIADSGTSVGTPGITWSTAVAASVVSIKLAVDNTIATGIRLRYAMRKIKVP